MVRPADPSHLARRPARRVSPPASPHALPTRTLTVRAMLRPLRITLLEGDETGQELLEQSLRVLAPEVVRLELELERFDLSLAHRRATDNEVVADAARAMRESGFGIKAATVTPEGKDDVGSLNRLLREQLDGKVIVRTGRRIPGITPLGGTYHPISVCLLYTSDAADE